MISSDLKWTEQVNLAVSKANRSIGLLKNVFTNLDVSSFKCLYKALIRPHLEYAVGIWSPYLRKDILKLENFQRRATKMVKSLKCLSYEQRTKILGLDFLEWRRKRGDLISTFKLIKGLDSAKLINNFNINSSLQDKNLRRHKFQMKRELVKNCPARYYFLMNRVTPIWNS